MKFSRLSFFALVVSAIHAQARNLVTDEPIVAVGKPEGAADYVARVEPGYGQHLALTLEKLESGLDRPFLIWTIGSSYTNMLGNGEFWKEEIPKRFPKVREVEYRKMVGNSCPWQYLRGWARHLVVPDQPDLVITYTIGDPGDLEKLLIELRSQTTADIIVPSIHWRTGDAEEWGRSENSPQQNVATVREVCAKYGVEFVENRRDWARYLEENQLPIPSLLKDAVHQSDYGAWMINQNILAHLRRPEQFSYDPRDRERTIEVKPEADGSWRFPFTGTRIDLEGRKSPTGSSFKVLVDEGKTKSFKMSYVLPNPKNAKVGKGSVPRDQAPHGIESGANPVPQSWTITMTSDTGDYRIEGSVTGPDGEGNAFQPFTSRSGRIGIDPYLWRRAERNRSGDTFTFEVLPAIADSLDFKGTAGEAFTIRLAEMLPPGEHVVTLIPETKGEAPIERIRVFQPPLAR